MNWRRAGLWTRSCESRKAPGSPSRMIQLADSASEIAVGRRVGRTIRGQPAPTPGTLAPPSKGTSQGRRLSQSCPCRSTGDQHSPTPRLPRSAVSFVANAAALSSVFAAAELRALQRTQLALEVPLVTVDREEAAWSARSHVPSTSLRARVAADHFLALGERSIGLDSLP